MSRENKKKKKSTSKYRKFKISPLIPVIAVVEVLVLIAISSYAWFFVSQEKQINTGAITVDADSGLNIDFKNANYDDEINLWDYVADDFHFSPVTSLDGRNVFVPTSGTFGNDTTNNIIYRDATINDINTKYIDVDFTLTNTNNTEVKVYLNNNSHFEVYDGNDKKNSRALRLAFYTNDAKHGNVGSNILENTNNENAALDQMSNTYTVYFNKPSGWSSCNAYVWKRVSSTNYVATAWPGSAMTHVAGTVYSYSFSNTENYDKIIFNNGSTGSGNQTADLALANGNLYQSNASAGSSGSAYTTKTVYFRKPDDWSGVKAHAFRTANENNSPSFTNYPGDECTDCGADVYSYTFPVYINGVSGDQCNGIVFSNSSNSSQRTKDLVATNGKLYYFDPNYSDGTCASIDYGEQTVYFNNTLGWEKPYVKMTSLSGHITRIPMINLSAGVYYATVPTAYNKVAFEERKNLSGNTEQTTIYKYTQSYSFTNGYIYRPNIWESSGYTLTYFAYTDYVGDPASSYAVISPGVSAGFQRSYTPVVGASSAGIPVQVVPAFASSIDNYIRSSGNAMFTIPANGMLDLSMIIWLEGTDADCTNENYAAKNIDLYLEFSTQTIGQAVDNTQYYTYRFYDKTRECWTSDRLKNAAGNTVSPVMQLYDATNNRGYLMHAASTTNIGSTRKVDMWECSAPAALYTEGRDLYFRRVDPYNEDEVWNYWHPVNPNECNGVALQQYTESGTTSFYVNFTAFADGAPASEINGESGISGNDAPIGAATSASTPARSCGGLWGKHETKLMTFVDGTDGHWFNNNNAVMTVNYTYSYGNSKTQTIEYKASGPYYNQLYYAVVPTGITSNKSGNLKINRFYNFNTNYAMNIKNRNGSMTFDSDNVFTFTGTFDYFAYFTKNGNSKDQWYGEAINYVNISYKDEGNNKNMFEGLRYTISFFKHNVGSKEVRLYTDNRTFSLNGFNGYLTVCPKGFDMYQLRRMNSNSWTSVKEYGNETNVTYRNAIIYYWQGAPNYIGGTYNNNQGNYGWPVIPSNYYPD